MDIRLPVHLQIGRRQTGLYDNFFSDPMKIRMFLIRHSRKTDGCHAEHIKFFAFETFSVKKFIVRIIDVISRYTVLCVAAKQINLPGI